MVTSLKTTHRVSGTYQRPTIRIVNFQQQSHLLAVSGGMPSERPTATYMSNPGIGDTDEE